MTEDLRELALRDPPTAEAASRRVIASSNDVAALSEAHQALGIVMRDAGRTTEAITELRAALRYAARSGADRAADVRASYGVALFLAGRTTPGLRALDRAVAEADGLPRAKVLMRRAGLLTLLGRQQAANADMVLALDGIRASGSSTWEARALNFHGYIQLSLGLVQGAEESFARAEEMFRAEGLAEEASLALTNRGSVAFARGDLPEALKLFGRVQPSDVKDGRLRLGLVSDHCDAYLAAGLTDEAVRLFERFAADVSLPDGSRADLNLALANVRLAAGELGAALSAATESRKAFGRQGRQWFELRARLIELRAREDLGRRRGLAAATSALAQRLHQDQADEAPTALMLAARLAKDADRRAFLAKAETYRHRPNAMVRASAWLAEALGREAGADRGGALRACGRGLDALDEHRQTLGSSELRAMATTHGRALAKVALRHAATADARTLLRWSERWRATALAQPPVTPGDDVPPSLAALRDNGRRLAEARVEGDSTEQLELERRRLEREVRAEHHRLAGSGQLPDPRLDVERLVAEVGDAALVELVDVDGILHVLVVSKGRVRRRIAGTTEQARELTELAGFVLRRAARGRPYDPGDLGERLQETLLGEAVRLLPDGPVVVAPTARLHGTPWALLPALARRPFSVVPSAAQWLRARAVPTPADPKLVLLAGPGLETGGSEIQMLAAMHPDALFLDGERATVEAGLDALDGAGLAHVAAHGHFRADSPLFSSLELADGPLTVHDLERLRVAPHRMVLSACESGVLAPVGAEELLGLASALFSSGTAGLVSSVAEVNDVVTAELMLGLHDRLAHESTPGGGLADALLASRLAASGDPAAEATAAAFLALGV